MGYKYIENIIDIDNSMVLGLIGNLLPKYNKRLKRCMKEIKDPVLRAKFSSSIFTFNNKLNNMTTINDKLFIVMLEELISTCNKAKGV